MTIMYEKAMVEKAIHTAWTNGFQHAVNTIREIADLTPDDSGAELLRAVADIVEKIKP